MEKISHIFTKNKLFKIIVKIDENKILRFLAHAICMICVIANIIASLVTTLNVSHIHMIWEFLLIFSIFILAANGNTIIYFYPITLPIILENATSYHMYDEPFYYRIQQQKILRFNIGILLCSCIINFWLILFANVNKWWLEIFIIFTPLCTLYLLLKLINNYLLLKRLDEEFDALDSVWPEICDSAKNIMQCYKNNFLHVELIKGTPIDDLDMLSEKIYNDLFIKNILVNNKLRESSLKPHIFLQKFDKYLSSFSRECGVKVLNYKKNILSSISQKLN